MRKNPSIDRNNSPLSRIVIPLLAIGMVPAAAPVRPCAAQLPVARLATVYPGGGQQGATLEITLTGADLDAVTRLDFSHPGIQAAPKTIAPDALHPEPRPVANTFTVTVAADVPPGIYEVRAVGHFGRSTARAFVIGDRPEIAEPEPNNDPAKAPDVTLGTVINGRVAANASDCFAIPAKKDQRIFLDCYAGRIDSRLDPVLVVYDAAGREMARSRNQVRQDPLIDFSAPADGRYVVVVYDFLHRGGPEMFYRLAISTAPHVDFILPPVGVLGSKSNYTVYGRNLPDGKPVEGATVDGKPLEQQTVEITIPKTLEPAGPLTRRAHVRPGEVMADAFAYRLASPNGASNPVLLSVTTDPVIAEAEPNNDPAKPQTITPPCEYTGRFYPRGDHDWVSFDAKKGDVYWIEVFSERLGLPTDPFMLIQRVTKNDGAVDRNKGEEQVVEIKHVDDSAPNIGGREFDTSSKDPVYRFAADQDATYRVLVRDLYNDSRAEPGFVYRLSIRREKPDFHLVAVAQTPPGDPAAKNVQVSGSLLRRGGTTPLKVLALRRDNFGGDIELTAADLPKGVHCPAVTLPSGENDATLILRADEDAPGWAGVIRILGKARIGDADVTRQARGAAVTWEVTDYNLEPILARTTPDVPFAVSTHELATVSITVDSAKIWETSLAGKVDIPVKVTRRGDFKGDLKLQVVGVPGMAAPPELAIAGAAGEGTLSLSFVNTDKNKFKPGTSQFLLRTEAPFKYRYNPQAADAAAAEVKRIEKLAAELAAKAKTAREAADKKDADDKTKEAATQAEAQANAAEQAKAEAQKQAKALADKANPKDVKVTFYSTPIALKLAAAPITLATGGSIGPLTPGDKAEIPVSVKRLYGFADPVELSVELPKGLTGVKVAAVTLPKDKTEAKLALETTGDAKPGSVTLTLHAKLKFNNQDLSLTEPVALTLAAPKKEEETKAVVAVTPTEPVSFLEDVLPIFERNCLACHNEAKAKGDLVLESPKLILEGGESGPAVVAKKSAESLLVQLVSHQKKPVMPPVKNRVKANQLTPEEIGIIQAWIDQGATGEGAILAGPTDWHPLDEGLHPIYAVSLTGDGQFAALGRADQVFVYHVATGQAVSRLIDPKLLEGQPAGSRGAADRDIVQSVAFSPDGDLVATGGYRTVKLWRRPHHVRKGTLADATDAPRAMAVGPQGKWAAVGDDKGKIAVFDLATGKIARTLTGHTGAVTGLSFTADGGRLVSGSLDMSIRLWNVDDGAAAGNITTPAPVNALVLANKSTQIAAAGADNVIRVWPLPADAKTMPGDPKELKGHDKPVTALATSSTVENLLVSGSEDGTVRRWNLADGKQVVQIDHGGPVASVAVRNDGQRFASVGADKVLKLWNGDDGKLVVARQGDFRVHARVTGQQRVVDLRKKEQTVYDAAIGTAEKAVAKQADTVRTTAEARTAAEQTLAQSREAADQAAGADQAAQAELVAAQTADKQAKEAKAAADKLAGEVVAALDQAKQAKPPADEAAAKTAALAKQTAEKAAEADLAATIDPQDEKLAQAKADADKAAADAAAQHQAAVAAQAAADKALADAAAKHQAATDGKAAADKADADADARAKAAAQRAEETKKAANQTADKVKNDEKTKTRAADLADEAIAEAGKAATDLFEAKSSAGVTASKLKQDEATLAAHKKVADESAKPLRTVAFSSDSLHLAAAGEDGRVYTYSATGAEPIDVFEGHGQPIGALAFAPDGSMISAANDKRVMRWDPQPRWIFERTIGATDDAKQLVHRVSAVGFSPDGKLLATGSGQPSRSSELKFWNVGDGKLVRAVPDAHSDTIFGLEFSPDGEHVATSAADRFVKVVEVATGKLVRSFEGHTHHVLDVSWRADGKVLASAGADAVIKIWNFETGDQIKTVSGFGKEVTSLTYVGLGDDLLACSGDKTVRINDRKFTAASDFLHACAVSMDGQTVVAGGQGGVLRVWNANDGKIRASFEPQPADNAQAAK